MKINDDSIKNVISMMADSIGKENVEIYKKLIDEKGFKNITDTEEFYFGLIYPFHKFMKGLIETEISRKDKIKFLLLNSRFIENQFNKIIVDIEGSACSSDKSRTIMKRLYLWFNEEKRIDWDYQQEYTFHLPKKVFTTHDDVVSFYEAIENLYYGHYKNYLVELKKVMSKLENEKK